MKKRTVILAASVVVILALLATVFFLLARNAGSSTGAEEPPANTTVETRIADRVRNDGTGDAEEPEPETPDGGAEPGETPPAEDPAENPGTRTPPVNKNGKIPISSPATLTDETTGKGIVSLGDSLEQVRETLLRYEPLEGTGEIENYNETEHSISFDYGEVSYNFDTNGYLQSYWDGGGSGAFETARGLKLGDPVSKMFELYGWDYVYNAGYPNTSPSYSFTFENTSLNVAIGIPFDEEPRHLEEGDTNTIVYEISCSRKR